MKTMRRANRWFGGAIALTLAYVLVLQSLFAAMAQGTLAAAHAEPLAVICTSHGAVVLAPAAGRDGSPAKSEHHWHCATLCQLASAAPAVLGAQTESLAAPQQHASAVSFTPAVAVRRACAGLIAEARAPPFSI